MEGRCAVLRDFGATECDDVEECVDIPWSLEGDVEEGGRYEELLRKMEDVKYLDSWLMSNAVKEQKSSLWCSIWKAVRRNHVWVYVPFQLFLI